MPNEISIDPLYEIQNEKINIKSPDDIKNSSKISHQEFK